jgi:hypothetical protein
MSPKRSLVFMEDWANRENGNITMTARIGNHTDISLFIEIGLTECGKQRGLLERRPPEII